MYHKSNKKRILFIIPSLIGGGAERTLVNLLQRIDYQKYEIVLVSVLKKGHYLNKIPQQVKLITLFKNAFWLKIITKLNQKYGLDYFFRRAMNRYVSGKYNVGISFLDGIYTQFLFFNSQINKRFTFVHSSYKSYSNFFKFYNNSKYKERVIRERYSKLDGIRFVSNDAMNEFIDIFGDFPNMKVHYNLINKDEILIKYKDTSIVDCNDFDTFSFVAVGSLLPIKGYELLIKAAHIISQKGYSFKLNILGSGPQEKHLQLLIRQYFLEDRIKLHGFVNNPYPFIYSADVFVMSSKSEALPTVLCEAMILGKPTLVTNCSGCRELVNNGEYGLMAEFDVEDYANNMISYLTDKNVIDYYSKKSLERAKLLDESKIMEEYYELFESE